jgi:hypothetical protein
MLRFLQDGERIGGRRNQRLGDRRVRVDADSLGSVRIRNHNINDREGRDAFSGIPINVALLYAFVYRNTEFSLDGWIKETTITGRKQGNPGTGAGNPSLGPGNAFLATVVGERDDGGVADSVRRRGRRTPGIGFRRNPGVYALGSVPTEASAQQA